MPTAMRAIPAHESSHVRRAQSARTYAGGVHPAKPTAARRKLAALVKRTLLDDLVRASQHRRRDRETERLRSLQVYHQLELGGLLVGTLGGLRDGRVGGLRALEDLVDVGSGASILTRHVRRIGHQASSFCKLRVPVYGRQTPSVHEVHDPGSVKN